jgi:hypothetical protein
MGVILAQASGNWSAASTWAGGILPGVGDTARSNGWSPNINQSIDIARLDNTGGGTFQITGAGASRLIKSTDFICTGNATLLSISCTGILTTQGLVSNTSLTANVHAIDINNVGLDYIHIGNSIGGISSGCQGIKWTNCHTYNILGKCIGGTGNSGYALQQQASSVGIGFILEAVGNDYGIGSATANKQPGVSTTNAAGSKTVVNKLTCGANGMSPILGPFFMLKNNQDIATFMDSITGLPFSLIPP